MSFEVILPFLRPIESLILDDEVSEIMVNGSSAVFVERHGQVVTVQRPVRELTTRVPRGQVEWSEPIAMVVAPSLLREALTVLPRPIGHRRCECGTPREILRYR